MVRTKQTPPGTEVIFDDAGNALRIIASGLARRLGRSAVGRDPVDHAIRHLGFVRVEMTEDVMVIDFRPATANRLAVIAAFYEIADRAPTRIVLMCRGEPDQLEVFSRLGPALRRVEELTKRTR